MLAAAKLKRSSLLQSSMGEFLLNSMRPSALAARIIRRPHRRMAEDSQRRRAGDAKLATELIDALSRRRLRSDLFPTSYCSIMRLFYHCILNPKHGPTGGPGHHQRSYAADANGKTLLCFGQFLGKVLEKSQNGSR